MRLNPHQRPIVERPIEGAVKTIAGAGTGKTFVLVKRYLKFVFEDGISPDRILALTFTTKAASEMRRRVVDEVVGRGAKDTLRNLYAAWIMNFHQFSFRVIKENAAAFGIDPDVGVATDVDLSRIRLAMYRRFQSGRIDGLPREFDDDMPEPARLEGVFDRWMGILTKARSTLWTSQTLLGSLNPGDSPAYRRLVQSVAALWDEYEYELWRRNLIDFSDMIRLTVRGLRENRRLRSRYVGKFQHILVDEFQDTSEAQNELLQILSGGDFGRVTVVGDDKQSIYRWRDARVQNLREFTGEEMYLRTNYRSSQNILDLAHHFIVVDPYFAKHPGDIRLTADRKEAGVPVCVYHPADESSKSFTEEAKALAAWILSLTGGIEGGRSPFPYYRGARRPLGFGDVAVLMRSLKPSSGLPEFEKEFQRVGIPYAISGGVGSLEIRVLGLLGNLLSLLIRPDDVKALLGVLEGPPFSLPDSALKELFDTENDRLDTDADALVSNEGCSRLSNAKARESCRRLRTLLDELRVRRSRLDLPAFVSEALELSAYYHHLFDGGADERLVESVSRTLFDLAEGLSDRNEANLAAFLESLQILVEKKAFDDAQGRAFPAGCVRIMTIHAAKGLEFPAVAVPGIKNPPNRREDFHLSKGRGLFVSEGAEWNRGLENSGTFTGEVADRDQEERCLLYVAMTRAKDHLYVSSPFPNGVERGDKTNLFGVIVDSLKKNSLLFEELRDAPSLRPPLGQQRTRGAGSETPDLARLVDEWTAGRDRLTAAQEAACPASEIVFVGWNGLHMFIQCPLMYHYRSIAGREYPSETGENLPSPLDPDATDEFAGDMSPPRGVDRKMFGAFVHQFLFEWASGPGRAEEADHSCRELLGDLAARYDFSASRKTAVVEAAAEMIRAFSASSLGSRSDVAYVEQPVHVRFDRVVFRGVVDRVDNTAGGYRIVDYKGKTERAEHVFQVRFYAWALGRLGGADVKEGRLCYLGVPTKIVEVDLGRGALGAIDHDARRLEESIGSGRFDPTPGEVCGTCAFNGICPSAGNAGRT